MQASQVANSGLGYSFLLSSQNHLAVLDDKFNVVDTIFFRQLLSKDLAIRHCGDEREGDAVGDDEKILIDLSKISPNGAYLCAVICS